MNKEPTKSNFYGDWVYYRNEEEKKEAFQYLDLWRKFLLVKLGPDTEEEQPHKYIIRENVFGSGLSTLGIKIYVKGDKTPEEEKLNENQAP